MRTVEDLLMEPNFGKAMGLAVYASCGSTYPDILASLLDKRNGGGSVGDVKQIV